MGEKNRAEREAEIYDDQALERDTYDSVLEHLNTGPSRLRRDQFIKEIASRTADKKVLEIGSQAWAAVFQRDRLKPGTLHCINISKAELDIGQEEANQNAEFDISFDLMDANNLEYPDNEFDLVYGVAILHHLDFEKAIEGISRVLKPGGEILFVEPLRLNPVAQIVRLLTPKARTPDELPLGLKELRLVSKNFHTSHLYTDFFLVPAAVLSKYLFKNPVNPLTRFFDWLDRGLLKIAPFLGPFYRSVTIYGKKKSD